MFQNDQVTVADEAGAVGDGPRELADTVKLEAKYSHTFSKVEKLEEKLNILIE